MHPLDRGHQLIATALAPILAPLIATTTTTTTTTAAPLLAAAGGEAGSAAPPPPAPLWTTLPLSPPQQLAPRDPPADTLWVDATGLTLTSPFPDSPTPYNRLPKAAQGVVRQEVWALGLNSAGITLAFTTDSPYIAVDMTCQDAFEPMPHFPVTGVSGMDFSVFDEASGHYRFAVPANNLFTTKRLYAQVTPAGVNVTQVGGKRLRWLANLPTYNTVVALKIGVAAGAFVGASPTFPSGPPKAPIVWYGTSILQGGVSFKSGEIETWRVARALNRQVFNFGFSGNGRMETSVGQFLATIPSPAAFIVDCSWNMDAASIAASAVPFVKFLREKGVTAPIFLSEGLPFGRNWAVPACAEEQAQSNAALAAAYQELVSGGDSALHYMTTEELYSAASVEDTATAAGLHASDAGMHDMATAWIGKLGAVLGEQ